MNEIVLHGMKLEENLHENIKYIILGPIKSRIGLVIE
jgi:hypothetical protein